MTLSFSFISIISEIKKITYKKEVPLRQPPDAYDRFLQKSVYEANTKHHFFQHFSISGHTTAPLFLTNYRGRGYSVCIQPGVSEVRTQPRVTQISSLRDFCSPYLSHLLLFLSFLYSPLAGGALPFAVDQKEEKVLSKSSFHPPHGFFFPPHLHEYPPKTVPANAGPDYFDWPALLFTFR